MTVPLPNEQAVAAVNRLIEALEDHDDVKEVYSNAESPDDAARGGRVIPAMKSPS